MKYLKTLCKPALIKSDNFCLYLVSKSILRHECKQCPDNQILTARTSRDGSCSQCDRMRIAEDAHNAEFCVSAGEHAEIRGWALWPNALIHRWLQNLLRPMGVGGPGSLLQLQFSLLPGGPGRSLSPMGSLLAWSYTPVHELNPLKPRARIKSSPSRLFLPGILSEQWGQWPEEGVSFHPFTRPFPI